MPPSSSDGSCDLNWCRDSSATRVEETAHPTTAESGQPLIPNGPHPGELTNRLRFKVIDKSVLAVPEPRLVHDRNHVKSVAKQACLICGRRPSDAHHLRFAQHQALGRKVSDEFTVPLCRGHHREVHRCGDEAGWWHNAGLEPLVAARAVAGNASAVEGRPTRPLSPLRLQPPARQIARMRRMNGGPVAAEQVARQRPSKIQFPTTSLRQIESQPGICVGVFDNTANV